MQKEEISSGVQLGNAENRTGKFNAVKDSMQIVVRQV